MSKGKNFIQTHDEETARLLEDEGFVLVEQSSSMWKFFNPYNSKAQFSDYIDTTKVSYTNKLKSKIGRASCRERV